MMSVAQIPAVPQQMQQLGTASAHGTQPGVGMRVNTSMDLAAAETVMVIDAEEIPVSVASQVTDTHSLGRSLG